MILLTRRAAGALVATTLTTTPATDVVRRPSQEILDPTTQAPDANGKRALILGGFLWPATAYDDVYVRSLTNLGYSVSTLAYNDPVLDDFQRRPPDVDLLVGHSKGAKTIAGWMPYFEGGRSMQEDKRIPTCVLIEPVDVNPPGALSSSSIENPSVLETWKTHLDSIRRVPTLIVSAPFTETSRRYGKAANLCAPAGHDASAFYEVASLARQSDGNHPTNKDSIAAPLSFLEFPGLGHNDVVLAEDSSSTRKYSIGGCADGPDRSRGGRMVSDGFVEWLQLIEGTV